MYHHVVYHLKLSQYIEKIKCIHELSIKSLHNCSCRSPSDNEIKGGVVKELNAVGRIWSCRGRTLDIQRNLKSIVIGIIHLKKKWQMRVMLESVSYHLTGFKSDCEDHLIHWIRLDNVDITP